MRYQEATNQTGIKHGYRQSMIACSSVGFSVSSVATLLLASLLASAAEDPPTTDLSSLVGLLELVIEADADSAKQCLQTLDAKIRSGEADAATLAELKTRLSPLLAKILAGDPNHPLVLDAALVAALWKDPTALKQVQIDAAALDTAAEHRKLALETLVFAADRAT